MDMRDVQPDADPQETREWIEALDSVLAFSEKGLAGAISTGSKS